MTRKTSAGTRIAGRIQNHIQTLLRHQIIKDRRYLDDEQLDRESQFQVLQAIFDDNVRSREINEITAHFAPIFQNDHPVHLSILGKMGTGKTVTILYLLHLLDQLCRQRAIPSQHVHLDLTTPKPCFRALNDLACLLDAAKRYKRGISLDELMSRIEDKLQDYRGFLILFIDEIDNVKTDPDTFMKFLVKRLPQKVPARIILVFASNRLNWIDNIDPRVRSFLKINELIFDPYNALDLQKILSIRVKKALNAKLIGQGVLEKIAAISSQDHGDARKAVELLAKSAHLAAKQGTKIQLSTVDLALEEIERDKYLALTKSSPKQLQAALYAILQATKAKTQPVTTGGAFQAYQSFCQSVSLRALTQRAFSDLLAELDMYGFVSARTVSKGRYGRTKLITLEMPARLRQKLEEVILMNFDVVTEDKTT